MVIATSLKTSDEVRTFSIFSLPAAPSLAAWVKAWFSACTGLNCGGVHVGFWNSVRILIPSVIISVFAGAVTGYALSHWRVRGANVIMLFLLLGAFIPYQVILYPLVKMFSTIGIYSSLPCIVAVHILFGLPVMSLLFRNFYAGLPEELVKAARIDGAGLLAHLRLGDVADVGEHPDRGDDLADHGHLERLSVGPDLRRPRQHADDRAAECHLHHLDRCDRIQCEHRGGTADGAAAAADLLHLGALLRARHHGRRGEGLTCRRSRSRGLSKSFGPLRVLQDIDLPVEAGEFTVLLGPSGCGKSTLLNAIAGLEDIDGGIVEIGGADVTQHEPSKRGIAMVFQSYALYPTMSVRGNLSFGLRVAVGPEAGSDKAASNGRRDCCRSTSCSIASRRSYPAASVSASPSAEHWCSRPRCSCSMNRCPTWTPSCGPRCALSSSACTRNSARPSSMSRMTRSRR